MNVIETITRRTSCRAYRQDPIPREHLERLVEAVRLAPSACNRQPWRLVIAQEPGLRRRIVDTGFLPGIRMPWASVAPALIMLGMQRNNCAL